LRNFTSWLWLDYDGFRDNIDMRDLIADDVDCSAQRVGVQMAVCPPFSNFVNVPTNDTCDTEIPSV